MTSSGERVSDRIAARLKAYIANGVFKAGDRLPSERDLSVRMGASRTSVREAIQQLTQLGLVETVHGGGSVVQNLAAKEVGSPIARILARDRARVRELSEVRSALEGWAAGEAARNRTEADLVPILRSVEAAEIDFRRGRIRFETDLRFHAAVSAATRNTVCHHMARTLHELMADAVGGRKGLLLPAGPWAQEAILARHRRVYEAIRDRDAEAAVAEMKAHLESEADGYARSLPPEENAR